MIYTTRGDVYYFARIIPTTSIYEIVKLKIRTIEDTWFVGVDEKTHQAHMFKNKDVNSIVFKEREKALKVVKEAEKNKKPINYEIYYEED